MDTPEVYKVIGAPGTGKTTRVVGNPELPDVTSLVMENLEEYPLEDQMIVTYTNAGVDEAADRLEKIVNEPRYKIENRVTTIHSQSYGRVREMGFDGEVSNWWNERNFCNKHNLTYGYDDDDQGDIMSAEKDEGHSFFDVYGWLKSNLVPIEDYHKCPAGFNSNRDFLEVAQKWEEHKKEENLIQFSDMIEICVRRGKKYLMDQGIGTLFMPEDAGLFEVFNAARDTKFRDPEDLRGTGPFVDTKILYVDEVQDLTPLQWAWYLMQKLVCEKVYIGGDDDQTIYGWAGANPDFMLNEEGDFEVLEKTYRIPKDIWEVCDGVIRQVDHRQEKNVEPHGDGGEVVTLHAPSPRQVLEHLEGDDSCFVLFRARYMIDEFRELMHSYGIPYRNMSTHDTWEGDVKTLRDALAKFKNKEEKLTGEEIKVMVEHATRDCPHCSNDRGNNGCNRCGYEGEQSMLAEDSGYTETERVMSDLGGMDIYRANQIFDLSHPFKKDDLTWDNFLEQTNELNWYEKQAIKGNLRRDNEHLDPDRIKLGTIHSAKGREAETVVVATDSTQAIVEQMIQDTRDNPDKNINDAERRVYYVAMTRASKKLVLAQGIIDREYAINLTDLLEDYEPDDDWRSSDVTYQSTW